MRKSSSTTSKLQRKSSKTEISQKDPQSPNNTTVSKGRRHTLFTDKIYLNLPDEEEPNFMKSFIKKGPKGFGICQVCQANKKDQERKTIALEIATENIHQHILSDSHDLRVKKENRSKHEQLVEIIKNLKAQKRKKKEDCSSKDKQHYLEFLAFSLKERLSFSQISKIGQYLSKMAIEESVGFLKTCSFTEEEISKVTQCFGESLLNNLKEELKQVPYSFCLDTATIAGENICALKVRYLSQHQDSNSFSQYQIKNQIIGIKTLKGSSTAEDYLSIVEEKLLNFGDDIRSNLIGVTHDDAPVLSGNKTGLVARIKKKHAEEYLFDLIDPCHSLSLTLQASLQILPEDLKSFIDGVHNHFTSPQRKAKLGKIQEERGENKLFPKHTSKHDG